MDNINSRLEIAYDEFKLKTQQIVSHELNKCHAKQSKYNNTVNRHLFPLSHIQIFSDSSIMTSLTMNDFKPRGAWYFGMDMYELACQLGYSSDEKVFFEDPGKFLLDLQPVID